MIPPTYKPKTTFMQLAIAEAKRARDRGDYAIGAVITQLIGNREVVIASARNRVKLRSLEQLSAAIRGQLIQPEDAAYDAARMVYNGMIEQAAEAYCACR